jgi:hypothetical protein
VAHFFDEWESKLGDPRSSRLWHAGVFLEAMFSTESMLVDPGRRSDNDVGDNHVGNQCVERRVNHILRSTQRVEYSLSDIGRGRLRLHNAQQRSAQGVTSSVTPPPNAVSAVSQFGAKHREA